MENDDGYGFQNKSDGDVDDASTPLSLEITAFKIPSKIYLVLKLVVV